MAPGTTVEWVGYILFVQMEDEGDSDAQVLRAELLICLPNKHWVYIELLLN